MARVIHQKGHGSAQQDHAAAQDDPQRLAEFGLLDREPDRPSNHEDCDQKGVHGVHYTVDEGGLS